MGGACSDAASHAQTSLIPDILIAIFSTQRVYFLSTVARRLKWACSMAEVDPEHGEWILGFPVIAGFFLESA